MSRLIRRLLLYATIAAAALASLWHYAASDLAFEHGMQWLKANQTGPAGLAFWIDRNVAQVRLASNVVQLGKFLRDRADDLRADEHGRIERDRYLEEAVIAFESFSGSDDLAEADALRWAALTLGEQYPFDPIPKAEPLLRRAIAIRDRRLGADNDETMPLVYALADLLLRRVRRGGNQDPLAEAKMLSDRLLVNAQTRNVNDPFWLELCVDVAAAQRRWASAEQCYRSAIEAFENQPGDLSSVVAEKLATILRAQGRETEASEVDKATFKFGRAKF